MGFKEIQAKIAGKKGMGMEKAGAILAASTRKTMAKHGLTTKHGIPKGVFAKLKKKSLNDTIKKGMKG